MAEAKAVITVIVTDALKDNVKIEFNNQGVPVEAIIVALDVIQEKLKAEQNQKIDRRNIN
jgi:hypothetical protein